MDFRLTPEQEAFRQEVRAFVKQEVTEDLEEEVTYAEDVGPLGRRFIKKLAQRGWVSMTWPKKFGGQERSVMDRLILWDELAYAEAPHGSAAERMGAPVIMLAGSPELQQEFLPRIATGEIDFALGYSEPEAGSDLASLKTRAVEDGDDFVISGHKIFNSGCHWAEYHWLAARTDPDAPKHKGISLFVVDMNTPGITVKPLWTMCDWRTNIVFYDNVRVPRRCLVGEKNRGFYQIAAALDLERIQVTGHVKRQFDDFVAYLRDSGTLARMTQRDAELTRHKLAGLAIEIETCRMLSYRTAWIQSQGLIPNHEASQIKILYHETRQHLAHTGAGILGLYGQVQRGDRRAPMKGLLEYMVRDTVLGTIAGGSSEINRNIIASRGLGLPR